MITESEFQRVVDAVLSRIERAADAAVDAGDLDIDVARRGQVLELAFDDRSKIVINAQPAIRELWMASRLGGQHFRLVSPGTALADAEAGRPVAFVDRAGEPFESMFSRALKAHGGADAELAIG